MLVLRVCLFIPDDGAPSHDIYSKVGACSCTGYRLQGGLFICMLVACLCAVMHYAQNTSRECQKNRNEALWLQSTIANILDHENGEGWLILCKTFPQKTIYCNGCASMPCWMWQNARARCHMHHRHVPHQGPVGRVPLACASALQPSCERRGAAWPGCAWVHSRH